MHLLPPSAAVQTFHLIALFAAAACTDAVAQGQGASARARAPVVFTTQDDPRNMMEQLGITRLRTSRSPNEDSPNAANFDEAKANPYPELPAVLETGAGQQVTTGEQWWDVRRPEIVVLLEREVYGRIPEGVPEVQWEVRQTREVEAGGTKVIQREIVGVVDNAACPEIEVEIAMSLTLPVDAKGPAPVLMSFGWTPFEMERFGRGGAGQRASGPRPPSKEDQLIAAGWDCATLNPSSIQDDSGGWQPRRFGPGADSDAEPAGAGLTRGIIGLTNHGQPRQPDHWGALRAWGWGASRALDYLEEHFIRWAEAQWQGRSNGQGSQSSQTGQRSLKEAAGDRFKIGVGVSHMVLRNPGDAGLIRQHFQIITPENCMKPQGIHPAEDAWDFEDTDGFIEFARANGLEVAGHCLVWAKDDRTDPWMMEEGGQPVSRETLLRRIETHISTVVGRYADAVTMWDVVNEAIADGGDDLLRDSVYSRTAGIDFIVAAFKATRAKDPEALLIYNDYNGHKPGKREKLIELLTQLKQAGAPVDAYGMQGHFELGDDSIPQLRETFAALRSLGLKVVVSELDIDVVTRGRWWAEDGKYRDELATFDPYKDGLPDEVQRQLGEQYAALFGLFAENSDIIERVSFWNLHDGQSWLNGFPWRRVNHPLLFDRDRKPKPAFDAVYELLKASAPR